MKNQMWRNDLLAGMFLLPFFLIYVVFTIFPIFKGLQMSFYDWSLIEQGAFAGFSQYTALFTDPGFWQSLWNTTLFVILSTPGMIILALVLALLANINAGPKLRTFLRGSYFIPSILSVSVISYIAIFMLQPYSGIVNNMLNTFGYEGQVYWLANPALAWLSIVGVTLWWTVGFNFILFLTSLQNIPDMFYEAAEIDGATRWQMFKNITLPQLIPISRVIFLLQVLASFKVFAQILLITDGGPGKSTRPLIQYIYEMGFEQYDLGYAAAMSYVLFFILLIFSVIQIRSGGQGRMI
ncbi:carbohydrate ABC transporter permease [Salibacterium halotolerans]|uniref:Multiple sugar transport system permease protein n=1 Tax=Salibacterium halotolerans TaxID=1884432 RepID=A0A1I5S4N2_9BACI|nr:sugar ABC transporter permease [Salibacterium halotolerans]SFP65561.1 multiple sugar transport system permease protein [Salibacterium halotolerans]